MGRLVTDLLDLARMESGHMTLYKYDISVIPFITRIANKFTQVARESNVDLLLDFSEAELWAELDADRIEQVVTNLIDNAIRHTPDRGRVTVHVERYGDMFKTTVSDTGDGISEEDLPFIFERFYKVDKARTRGKGGTGLGLAIAKNIIDSHGGVITATRGVEKGTVMTVTLPLK